MINDFTTRDDVRRFSRFAWVTLGYNVLVILWGAGVRATGSGAGCGSHYPLCNGVVVPRDISTATFIELTHRATSGIALLLIIYLVVRAVKLYRQAKLTGDAQLKAQLRRVRLASCVTLFFTLTEATIGAGLVIFELVADNDSVARAAMLGVHLINTFLLLGALTLAAWWSRAGASVGSLKLNQHPMASLLFAASLAGTLMLGASGAVAALGDTLFPVKSLGEGLSNDLTGAGHYLVQLRVLHPVLAAVVGMMITGAACWTLKTTSSERTRKLARVVMLMLGVEIVAGGVNVLLLAPVWMQIIHLLLADAMWIGLVLLTATTFESCTVIAPETENRELKNRQANSGNLIVAPAARLESREGL